MQNEAINELETMLTVSEIATIMGFSTHTVREMVKSGHTHRVGRYSHTNRGGSYASWENGCLCQLKPEYIKGIPDWSHALSIIHVSDNDKGMFNVQQIDILNRSLLFYGGKEYS